MANPKKIIIIGGGVMGLSCAWRLAEAGAQVELYETRQCGEGATLASLGALWPASPLADGPQQKLHRESLWAFENFVQELAEKGGLPVGFKRLGRLEILNSEKAAARAREEAAAACAKWPSFGTHATMQFLAEAAAKETVPGLAAAPFGALLCRATAQVHVPELVQAIKAACLKTGVTLHEQTPVTSLLRHDNRVAGIKLAGLDKPADVLLITAGAWTSKLLPTENPPAIIRPVKGQGLAIRLPAGTTLNMIVKSGPIYLVPWHDKNEILVGSTTEPEAAFDETPTAPARETLLAGGAQILPALASATLLRHWAGLRPQNSTKGHPPVMTKIEENLYLCAGHYKTGIGMAPISSRLMTQTLLSQ